MNDEWDYWIIEEAKSGLGGKQHASRVRHIGDLR
jgi:hypothetical protein